MGDEKGAASAAPSPAASLREQIAGLKKRNDTAPAQFPSLGDAVLDLMENYRG